MEEKKPISCCNCKQTFFVPNQKFGQIICESCDPFYSVEEKVTLSEMFEFVRWKDGQRLMHDNLDKLYFIYEVSHWIKIGSEVDLWNKFKERNK